MTMTFDDLLPLMPMLIVTATAIIAMLMIGVKRSYLLTSAITITGLLLASVVAAAMLPFTNQQITPLFIIDHYSLFFTVVMCASAMFISILSFPYFFNLDDQKEEFYLLLVIATIGAIVMVSSNHFVSTLLGLETLSMSLYGMVAYPLHSKESAKYPLEASVKYLILSAVASGFIVFGMALVYAQTGTLSFTSLVTAASLTNSLGESYSIVALLMISAGMAFKLSLAPFHLWTPDVYEGSPLPATTYLATVGKAAMFVVFLRFIHITEALSFPSVVTVFSLIAVASILAGNLLALLQDNLKRILAYSSIAHMGYLMIAVIATYSSEGTISIEAVTFYLLAYVIMSLGGFGVASVISSSEKEFDSISDYRGLFWRNPWLASSFMAMLLSLAGIPLTIGFIGKFYIFLAGVESGLWVLLAVLVVGSGIGLYYYLRIIYRMLMPVDQSIQYRIAGIESISSYGVLAILVFLLLLFGIYPAPVMSLVADISAYI
ncbi:MAG: NADH-quinone oxidoreductase subunit N [SAR86 cluster bacterium]|uniref:NADH-quinone oxidoreductase subunit N n=1 Tax=SAR86 cluster bacterium TaxID=2030880 RepID=A0A2A5BAT5_9GAMM|nr:MAG: NADH-quinone oxidoreductase subunit N [SAR86 cluster bacterium]